MSSARNLALEMMEAFPCAFDLVCFVDGDDIIKPHFIRNYVDHFQNNSVDYVVCGWNPFDKVGIVDHGRERHLDVITSNSGAYRHLFLIGEWKGRLPVSFAYFLSNKCFSARVLYGLRFDESLSRGEDLDFVIRSLLNVKPKISDFGAVDDEGKRSISLWHKQTPGIPGVDFYLERLYNILQP